MKKAIGQTVRDLKRGVNKNVLKVPGIEQKVLDATSNESWGPHGSILADIALATRNYHEYQMIMSIIWKRINDTGKNWRHVFKALTVLEYLVGHGSERVIDEIREHSYQISTLADFQYIDSSGRDQGSNVRKKSQSLVALVNDKDRLIEVRQKAAINRDKFRSTASTGGMYRPGSGGYLDRYEDDRYGNRDDDRYGRNGDSYGREKEWGYKDDDRYGRNGDRNEDRYGRDGYKDDDYRERSQSVEDGQYGRRSRSSEREGERSFDDDGQHSSRSGPRIDDSQEGRRLDRKFSEQNIGAPPSYEEAVTESQSPVPNERGGENAAAPSASSPAINNASTPPPEAVHLTQPTNGHNALANPEMDNFDEFDPRGSFSAAPVTANNPEMDLLGSLALAIVPTESLTTAETEPHANFGSSSTFTAAPSSAVNNQPFGDPFGDDAPFKAFPSETMQAPPQTTAATDFSHGAAAQPNMPSSTSSFDFGDPLSGITYSTTTFSAVQAPANSAFMPQDPSASHQSTDVLADILPPSGPPQPSFSAPQPVADAFGSSQPHPGMLPQAQGGQHGNYLSQAPTLPLTSHMVPHMPTGYVPQINNGNFLPQGGPFGAPNNGNFYAQQSMAPTGLPGQPPNGGGFQPQQSPGPSGAPQIAYQPPGAPISQQGGGNDILGSLLQPTGPSPSTKQPKEFATKSTVWADTLSRGLVNLNISGPKANPMADIGVDFDALNRREKRLEKPVATPVTSTITMGKAMGSGSGMGRTGAGGLRPPANPMMGGPGTGVGGYGGMNNQPMGMGMNMGMNMNMGGMGMGQMRPGFPPGSNVPGGYNPMMGGPGGYAPQHPYGGYR